jgi:formylglycine-generating enzyme required for sulfatase activity
MKKSFIIIFCLIINRLYGQDTLDNQNIEFHETLVSADLNLQKKSMPDFKNRYFQCMKYIDTFKRNQFYQPEIQVSESDSNYFFDDAYFSKSLNPFYILDHEVTNLEYLEFVQWVRDSLVRIKLFERSTLNSCAEWITYVDFNSGKKDDRGQYYILNWDKKLDYENPNIMPLITDLFVKSESRFNRIRNWDVGAFYYEYFDEKRHFKKINVYPDTACWERELNIGENQIKPSYFWNEKFMYNPVVGVNFEQANAYCHWRTKMYHKTVSKKNKKNYDPLLKFRLPTEEEWVRASSGLKKNEFNNYRPIWNGFECDENGYYQANYGKIELNSGLLFKESRPYSRRPYLVKVHSYKSNFNGLHCMFGNVAEWVDAKPKLGDFYSDYLNFEINQKNSGSWKQNMDISNQLYLTDPYTDSTHLVVKDSKEHLALISKRLTFYKINPNDTFEEVKRKYCSLNSVDESYHSKIFERNEFKDTIKFKTSGLIDGIYEIKESTQNQENYVLIYNIYTGKLSYNRIKTQTNYTEIRLKKAFEEFKQNSIALNTAQNRAVNELSNDQANSYENCRKVKGGSWNDQPHYLLINNSQIFHKNEASSKVGFRIVADSQISTLNKKDKKRIKRQRKIFGKYYSIWQ